MSKENFAGLHFQPGATVVSGVVVTAAFGERTQIHRDQVQEIAAGEPHPYISQDEAAQAEQQFIRFNALAKGLVERYNVGAEHKAMEIYQAEMAAASREPSVEPLMAEVAL